MDKDVSSVLKEAVAEVLEEVRRVPTPQVGNSSSVSTTVVKLEGVGSLWGGIAIGTALGATILGVVWIMATLNRQEMKIQQGAAYQQAVYALAPRFAAEIDEELNRQREAENVHTNSRDYRPRPADDDPAAESAPSATSD